MFGFVGKRSDPQDKSLGGLRFLLVLTTVS
jgi:hypothetical protein